eukprot:1753024-Prymnesium_polylepis.1
MRESGTRKRVAFSAAQRGFRHTRETCECHTCTALDGQFARGRVVRRRIGVVRARRRVHAARRRQPSPRTSRLRIALATATAATTVQQPPPRQRARAVVERRARRIVGVRRDGASTNRARRAATNVEGRVVVVRRRVCAACKEKSAAAVIDGHGRCVVGPRGVGAPHGQAAAIVNVGVHIEVGRAAVCATVQRDDARARQRRCRVKV